MAAGTREKHEQMADDIWCTVGAPDLTSKEAIMLCVRLYEYAGLARRVQTTLFRSRYTRGGLFVVSPDDGWQKIVLRVAGDISNYVSVKGHMVYSTREEWYLALTHLIIDNGWLDGRLRDVE